MRPYIDYLVVTLVVGDESHRIVVHHFLNLLVTFSYKLLLFRGMSTSPRLNDNPPLNAM